MFRLCARRCVSALPGLTSRRLFSQVAVSETDGAETIVTTLSNGLRVASEQSPHQTATVGVFVDAGSRFEDDRTNGTAHFLEHMAFKGTSSRTQTQLELEVENIGCQLNAYTGRETTSYYGQCFVKDLPQVVNLLSDILQNSTLDEEAIELERHTILREIQEVANHPLELSFDYLHATAFQNHPLGRTILGPEENVKSITKEDLRSYIQTHYTAPRVVVAAAGGVDHDELVKMVEKNFGGLSADLNPREASAPVFTGSEVRVRDDSRPQAHINIAVEGVSWSHEDYFPLIVASALIGTWDRSFGGGQNLSSKLAQQSHKNNLAHNYMSYHSSYTDTGLWGIYAECDHNTIEDFIYEVQQEWMRVCTSLKKFEVDCAKNQLKASMLFQIDGTFPTCNDIGTQMLTLGQRRHPRDLVAAIDAVTVDQVQAAAYKYIFDKDPAVVGYGPIEQLTDYNRIRSGMFWLRV
eukprot:m.46020 g.46020  ORF g.46020 m.46020 type:complete len:465 (-) comp17478_c0_seq1:154-1548(-)